MKLAHLARIAALALPSFASAETWSVRTQEVWNFYNNIATAKIGKVVECYGDWNLQDPPNVVVIRCESLGLPAHHPSNHVNINRYLHNGWEIADRQVLPLYQEGSRVETQGFKRVMVRLKKVERRSQYVDPSLGPMDPVVRP